MKKKADAERAIETIAMRQGVTVGEVKNQMNLAIRAGMRNQDPAVQARWKKIPCKGDAPTPEELIAYLAARMDADDDPFV